MTRIFHSLAEIPSDFPPSALTIGKFDGVHRGHTMVIDQVITAARAGNLASVVVTFDRNPLSVLAPDKAPPALTSSAQKLELLEATGVDNVVVLPFDDALSHMSAEDFARDILGTTLNARVVFVGADFRYGYRGSGTVESLREVATTEGFEVELVDDLRSDGDNQRVSSSWIRELVTRGDVAQAARFLGRAPSVRGIVVQGDQRGRELGFPTANLSADCEGLVPADGVYAGWLADADEGQTYTAAISVGTNPTFNGHDRRVEAYVPGRDLELYDHHVDIGFVERVRSQIAFDSVEALIDQMTDDVEHVVRVMGEESSHVL